MPLVALATAGAGSLWLASESARDRPPDPRSASLAVFEYLEALEGRSPQRLAELVPPTDEGRTDIEEHLRRFGGARVAEAEVRISPPRASTVLAVSIRTVGADARELAWTENLVWGDGRWRLMPGGSACDRRGLAPLSAEPPSSDSDSDSE